MSERGEHLLHRQLLDTAVPRQHRTVRFGVDRRQIGHAAFPAVADVEGCRRRGRHDDHALAGTTGRCSKPCLRGGDDLRRRHDRPRRAIAGQHPRSGLRIAGVGAGQHDGPDAGRVHRIILDAAVVGQAIARERRAGVAIHGSESGQRGALSHACFDDRPVCRFVEDRGRAPATASRPTAGSRARHLASSCRGTASRSSGRQAVQVPPRRPDRAPGGAAVRGTAPSTRHRRATRNRQAAPARLPPRAFGYGGSVPRESHTATCRPPRSMRSARGATPVGRSADR